MRIMIGGIHTDAEQDNVKRSIKRVLAPLIVVVEWRPRPPTGKDEIVIVEGANGNFAKLEADIKQALSPCGYYYHDIVPIEATALLVRT